MEVIQTYIEDRPPENSQQAVWYLGKSIQLLAEADFFIGVEYTDFFKDCKIESEIAREYGIRSTYVNIHEMIPDALEVERKYWKEMDKGCSPKIC